MPEPALKRPYAPHLPPEERREQLLDVGLEIIAELGVRGVTVERVAQRAGVTRPVVYGQFEDANHILRTLLDREFERAMDQLGPLLSATGTPTDPAAATEGLVRAYLGAVLEEPVRWRTILLPVGEDAPARLRRHERGRELLRERLEPLLAGSNVNSEIDTQLLARFVLEALENAGRLVLSDPEQFSPDRISRFTAALVAQFIAGAAQH